MKGSPQLFTKLFADSDTRFVIPLYQRNYDWKEEHCRQLFSDLLKLHNDPSRESHFFGSIVSRRCSLSSDEVSIIDGQQRLTTVSLLLIAVYNAAVAGELEVKEERNQKKILNKYLVDEYANTERKVKLKPIKKDMEAFDALLFKKPSEYVENSNVTRNYRLFYEWVTACDLSLDEILASVEKLIVIDIRLDEKDDPQLIFESLNSTGKDLEEADKIRNYLLMSLNDKEQEYYYNNYWNKMEVHTHFAPTMFIRDYLTVQTKKICKIEQLYREFKLYVEERKISRQELLTDLLRYSEAYHAVKNAQSASERLCRKLQQLNTLGSSVGMPFYMSFWLYAHESSMSTDEIYKVLDVIENYWARRIVCNMPTNALNKVFSTLHADILRIIAKQKQVDESFNPSYLEVLKYVILRKSGSAAFPQDDEMREEFNHRQIYHIPSEYKYFLFERLENEDCRERHAVVSGMQKGEITIEHIMPQTLTPQWQNALGPDFERIHKQYLHTFANLTLTGYNSNYGNRPFAEKKNGYVDRNGNTIYGFKDSGYRLNKYLNDCDGWTESQILERQQILFDKVLKLWPMITTNFEPKELTDVFVFDPDESDELTGRSITAFSYKGERFRVSSFADMLVSVCGMVYRNHMVIVRELCHKNNSNFRDNDMSREYSQFAEGCWVWKANSTHTKMGMIRTLFDACGIAYADLEIEVYPDSNVGVISSDNEQLKAFWDYFYDYQVEHDGIYKDCTTPHTVGYAQRCESGANVTMLVYKTNYVRAEIYWDRWDAKRNKEIFDKLYTLKDLIEKQVGVALEWERLDEKRACRISISKPYIYKNESDYQLIIEFFTEMSNKFWNIIVPIFKDIVK